MEKRGMQFVRYADGHVMIRKMAGDQVAAQADLSADEWDEIVEHMDQCKAALELTPSEPFASEVTEGDETAATPPAPKKVPAKKKKKPEAPAS